jgi:acyl dehydratase
MEDQMAKDFEARWRERVGQSLGVSDWIQIDQTMIDQFADLTRDRQWIHIDVERATREMGGPIAHGFLTLSMMSTMAEQIVPQDGVASAINYGFDKIRFPAPVPAGARVRLHERLLSVEAKGDGFMIKRESTVEVEGQARPAIVAEWLSLLYPDRGARAEA